MDEPTSAITDTEVEMFFNVIRHLKEEGRSIIYISCDYILPEKI